MKNLPYSKFLVNFAKNYVIKNHTTMMKIKTLIAGAMIALSGANAMAQECCQGGCCAEAYELGYKPQPYTFIQVQAGANTTFTSGSNFMDLVNPTFSLGVGRMFTPVVGARLHFNGYQASSRLNSIGETKYKFNYVNSNIDVMLNVLNIFRKTNHNAFDLYLVGGFGLNYAWKNDEFTTLSKNNRSAIREDISNAWGDGTNRKDLLGHSIRAGLLADINLSKHFSLGLEADINSLSDRFNSKYNDADDWMLTAQVSLTYKFGHKKCEKPAPAPAPEPAPAPKPAPAPAPVKKVEPAPAPAPAAVVEKPEPLKETFFYKIRQSGPETEATVERIIAWCNKYPEKGITIDGYADKGTGNAKINKMYAEKRAKSVADKLKARGIAADRMKIASYGDTVQPFEENDKNRCVIVVGE